MTSDSSLTGPVLVIGGCGLLGYHIVKQLVETSDASNVTVLDVTINANRVPGAKYVKGSVGSRSDVLTVLQQAKPRVIMQTASPKLMGQSNSRKLFEEVNISGTRNLLDCIYGAGFTKVLVYTSSTSVVHDNCTDLVNVTESLPLYFEPEQKEFYSHTKAVAENMIRTANRQNGLLTTVLRANTLFGEGDTLSIPTIVENAKAGRGNFQVGNGTNLFDFTYAGNTAYAHILAAKALLRESTADMPTPDQSKVDGEAFAITNDDPWPFWDFTRAVGAAAGYPVKKEDIWVVPESLCYNIAVIAEWVVWAFSFGCKESRINRKMVRYTTMTRTFDITKARERLGYCPQVSMQEGIKRGVNWYLSNSSDSKKAR